MGHRITQSTWPSRIDTWASGVVVGVRGSEGSCRGRRYEVGGPRRNVPKLGGIPGREKSPYSCWFTHGWKDFNDISNDLKTLIQTYHNHTKEILITTGGSGLTAELGCSLPGASKGCDPKNPPLCQDDLSNLNTFITNVLITQDWDLWTPQIYDVNMVESWYDWEKPGYKMWADSFDTNKIALSVGQKEGYASINSMKDDLKAWMEKSGLFPSLKDALPIVGFPYNNV